MKRFNLILFTLSLSIAPIAAADKMAVTLAAEKPTEQGPVEVIQATIVKLNQLTVAAVYSPQMASALVDKEITPLFDFNYIANAVLLVVNANLNDDEVRFFANKLKKNITDILLLKLTQANSTSFSFISARPITNNKIVVKLRMNGYAPFGFYVDLWFHQNKDNKWQIFDVMLNNDSLISYYQKTVLIQARRYGIYKLLGRI